MQKRPQKRKLIKRKLNTKHEVMKQILAPTPIKKQSQQNCMARHGHVLFCFVFFFLHGIIQGKRPTTNQKVRYIMSVLLQK